MDSPGDNSAGFWRKLLRIIRNVLILVLILAPCLYSITLKIRLDQAGESIDSLRFALASGMQVIDSLKTLQDNDILTRDRLDDMVDRKLGDRATEVMFMIDTTIDASIARKVIEEKMDLESWVDSLRAPYPEGVSAHVKLRYLESLSMRMERIRHHYNERFGE